MALPAGADAAGSWPRVTVGTEVKADTELTSFYILRGRDNIDVEQFWKGFVGNNRHAFVPYTKAKLSTVRSRCSPGSAAQHARVTVT